MTGEVTTGDFVFKPSPKHWDRSCHRYPCPETDRIDCLLNELFEWTFQLSAEDVRICAQISKRRQQSHDRNSTQRFYDDQYAEQTVGVKGEYAFSKITGLEMDRKTYAGKGDDGFDFRLENGTTVDVKTAYRPKFLLLKTTDENHCADILVLSGFVPESVSFIGWSTREELLLSPVKDFGYGIRNHFIASSSLNPMMVFPFT